MHRLLRRKAVTIVAAIITFAAIPVAITVTAGPALAAGDICNVNGLGDCAGGGSIAIGAPVTLESGGRVFNEVAQNFTCCGGWPVFQLQYNENPARCMGVAATSNNVTVRDCSGGDRSRVNWAREDFGSYVEWFNNRGGLLTSHNIPGQQLFVVPTACTQNCFFKWSG
ncbi:MAG TPA: hypothetical protein VKU77_24565 [Streptosporangiaceae bacterium]|nr:hypothetical protein [Streptosporangiaceae bacterium]